MSSSVPYFVDEEEPRESSIGFTDSPEFNVLKEEIVTQLFEINGQISTLQQFISTLESLLKKGNVSAKVVDKIDKKSVVNIRKVGSLIKNVNEQVQKIDAIEESSLDRPEVIAREKIVRDVRYSLQEFQSTQRKYANVIRDINNRARAALNQEEESNITALREEEEGGLQKQQLIPNDKGKKLQITIEREPINNEEFAYQQNLIRQRDQEISNIEEGITELNEIFKDLGNVVQQQGIMVDNIEANIYSTSDNTAMASRELNKAYRSQKSANKWCLYLLAGLLIMLFMLLLIVFI
ncbi:SNAP receptor PEP12 TDEL_0A04960 [Torulaspora delbrueckii]|uniref:t-SNARE coiled-coil homology domain-containing protein n=1 Tax=Torulaspora delbrueckii TaxID=4950 RepID=G8ZMI4_TORDE|nr:hypothetical protein TDEL_0A04960 [Torulaspora delbrueckii]CCE89828.1 hypothetical protein TDEL_0A04960 [Torulaspora delbrueckii]